MTMCRDVIRIHYLEDPRSIGMENTTILVNLINEKKID